MGHVCSLYVKKICAYRVFVGKSEERVCFYYFGVCGRIIFKWISKKRYRALTGLFRLRIGTDGVRF